MKKKSIFAVILVVVLTGIGLLVHRVALARETPALRFATVQRGDLQSVVSATGTLNAVTTVSVGTQVSGQISSLVVDYNDHVRKGQLLATIDPTLAQQAVTDANANLAKVEAQSEQASRNQNRNHELAAAGLIAKSELEQSGSDLAVAQADVRSAQVALDRARQNLSYTNIDAPIDGVVVEKNVQQGQTVAASLSAPQLFLIANDLTHMQILAQVGESDIEQIEAGQPVNFTVQALPGQSFKGTVQQVRLQSTTTDNVVDYTVAIDVANPGQKLLPGMTARVDFLVKSATNVLEVPNAALRFHPSDDLLEQLGGAPQPAAKTATAPTTATTTGGARSRTGNGQHKGAFGTLYALDANGKVEVIRVHTGLTDGTSTAIDGKSIVAGLKVITGATQPSQTASSATSSGSGAPFQSNQQQGRRNAAGGF